MTKARKPARDAEVCEVQGEEYYLSKVTPGIRKRFAIPVCARARQSLFDSRTFALEEAGDDKEGRAEVLAKFAEDWELLQNRIDAGAYEWGPPLELGGIGMGDAIDAVLQTPQGQVRLLQILLEEQHGRLTPDEANDLYAANPHGIAAAIRAAMGYPPLPIDPPESHPTTGETNETTESATTKSEKKEETTRASD